MASRANVTSLAGSVSGCGFLLVNIYGLPLPILQIEADGGSSDFLPTQGQAAGCLRAFNNPSGQTSALPKGVVSRAFLPTALIATSRKEENFSSSPLGSVLG